MNRLIPTASSMPAALLAAVFLLAGAPGAHAQDVTTEDTGEDTGEETNNDALPFARPGPDSAMIVGAVGRRAQYIYPVEFVAIDGKNIHPREVMWLEPGEYELTVRAFITNPPGLKSAGRFRQTRGSNKITVVVEADKEYAIGMKFDRSEPMDPYRTVLYKVEEN